MKAIVYTEYGSPDVLQLKEVVKPTPKDDEVLVKVFAVSANAADLHLLRADPVLIRLSSGLLKPKNQILGSDIAGRVEAVGSNIKQFKPGDRGLQGYLRDAVGEGLPSMYVSVKLHWR
jgi:NADPH:quinone reductase-like Zn-dependent oxidoreductase